MFILWHFLGFTVLPLYLLFPPLFFSAPNPNHKYYSLLISTLYLVHTELYMLLYFTKNTGIESQLFQNRYYSIFIVDLSFSYGCFCNLSWKYRALDLMSWACELRVQPLSYCPSTEKWNIAQATINSALFDHYKYFHWKNIIFYKPNQWSNPSYKRPNAERKEIWEAKATWIILKLPIL